MSADPQTWAVVGLGNPGEKYAGTRHNIGAMAAVLMAEQARSKLKPQRRARCDVADARIGQSKALLAVPQSYMNESGGPVSSLIGFYKIQPDRLIVIHDEIDLPFGSMRVKFGGGDNGHNGLKSVRRSLGTGDWYRVRLGVGRSQGGDTAGHVLSRFSGAERKTLPDFLDTAAAAVESLIQQGLDRTQSEFNS